MLNVVMLSVAMPNFYWSRLYLDPFYGELLLMWSSFLCGAPFYAELLLCGVPFLCGAPFYVELLLMWSSFFMWGSFFIWSSF